jgi:hypothetical protein
MGEERETMKTVVAVYTGQGLADPLKAVFKELLPDVRLVNIIDDSLIGDKPVLSSPRLGVEQVKAVLAAADGAQAG